jgi:hypothetical protein
MRKKYLLYIFFIIIITPIATNYILTREIVCNYDVAGSGVDWISFYGSFLGSVISAIVAYYVMYNTLINNEKQTTRTLQQSKYEHIKMAKRDELDFLRRDLSERIGQINVFDIFRLFMFPQNFDVKEEMERLNELYVKYAQQSNSSLLIYGIVDDKECQAFYYEYNSFLTDLCREINKLTTILAPYLNPANDRKILCETIEKENAVLANLSEGPKIILEKAKEFYYKKKKEYDVLSLNNYELDL